MSPTDTTVKGLTLQKPDGKGIRVLIVHTRWNSKIVDALVKGCIETLKECGVTEIGVSNVAGAFELPFATKTLLQQGKLLRNQEPWDVAISIGVLIKGSTMHFEYIADATTHGLMQVGLGLNSTGSMTDFATPVIFGVLTCLNDEQALARAGLTENGHNHGIDWAVTALEQARLKKGISTFKYVEMV